MIKIKINKKYLFYIKLFKSKLFIKKNLLPMFKKIPKLKKINLFYYLKNIPGINNSIAYFLLTKNGISPLYTFKNKITYLSKINTNFENLIKNNNIILYNNVKKKKKKFINNKINIKSYKGIRHKIFLPVRGQRTS